MVAIIGLLMVSALHAAPYQGPDPVRLLLLNADACGLAISMKALTTDATELAKFDDDRKKALSGIEEDGEAAINFAGNSAEVKIALKDFYTIADSYCKNPTNPGKVEFKSKERALDKLLEASGR